MKLVNRVPGRVKETRSRWQKGQAAGFLILMHFLPITLFYTGTRMRDWILFGVFYVVTIFALGGILHRYFGHRAFQTSRWFQFVLALLPGTVLGDAIGFSGKHRLHHRFSDTDRDVHSPRQGIWFCWIGSLLDEGYTEEEILRVTRDLTAYPELVFLHRYFYLPALGAAALAYLLGGYATLVVVYGLNFLVAVHGPSAVNYFCHRGGRRNFETADDSTNRILLGYLFLGEGWHNNHHYCPGSARLGFRTHEFDASYHILRLLAAIGLIWDLHDERKTLWSIARS